MYKRVSHDFSHKHQAGVVLIMALVAMGVIAVTSALAIRSVTLGDRVGSNLRSQQMAMYAAEVALRWCEADVLRGVNGAPGSAVHVPVDDLREVSFGLQPGAVTAENWRVLANWSNVAFAITVPADLLRIQAGNNTILPFGPLPQCMAQKIKSNEIKNGQNLSPFLAYQVQITARGFSPDYTPRTANSSGAGGEVWLQSMIKDYINR